MPLLDHFQSSWAAEWPWDGIHATWATKIAEQLNDDFLPPDFHAIPQSHVGTPFEIDVATLQHENGAASGNGGVATEVWAPPKPAISLAVDITSLDVFEVKVIYRFGGAYLRAAIELVSPGNKDRPGNRHAFAVKCAGYLQSGVSVIIIDVVTNRTANLHADILRLLQLPESNAWQSQTKLYGIAHRRVLSSGQYLLEAWPEPLAIGKALPTLPLWLDVDLSLPLNLEDSYTAACNSLRIPV